MMQRTLEWLNSNRYRRYPFVDDADMTLAVGVTLDDAVLVDFNATTTTVAATAATLRSITSTGPGNAVTFGFDVGGVTFNVAVPADADYPYTVQVSSYGIRAAIVFDDGCESIRTTPASYVCNIALQPALVVAQARHRVDTVASAYPGQATLSGHILVEPGYNCEPVVAAGIIRLVAGRGLGLGRYCLPPENSVLSCADALLRINGATASEDGNINLVVEGAQVVGDNNAHTVTVTTPKLVENMRCG